MLTLQQIKADPAKIIERLAVKNFDGREAIEKVVALDNERRALQLENDNLASSLNKLSASIGALMKAGNKAEAEQAKAEVAEIKSRQRAIAERLDKAAGGITEILLSVPNVPYEGVPAGKSAADNVVEKTGGPMPDLPADALPHWDLAKKYGIIEGVSDRPYVSNSFHCHVTEDVTPIEKQDLEGRFWELCNGGKIQYVRYPIGYNKEAIRTLIRRAMDLGYYEGVNLSLAYCDDCGHQELDMDVCPVCGSKNLTKIDRMNGYLSYSRVHGDTRLNEAKMAEIAERKSM